MTLAEAIAHEDWAATTAHGELAAEHAQMRDWLRELERLRDENAKLQELVQYICDENYGDDWFAEKAAELGIEAHY